MDGNVARSAELHGGRMTVDKSARVDGNRMAHVSGCDDLGVASGAVVKGQTSHVPPLERSRRSVAGSILWAGLRPLAALVAG